MTIGDTFRVSTGTLTLLRFEGQGKDKIYVFDYKAEKPAYSKEVKQTEGAAKGLEKFKINTIL